MSFILQVKIQSPALLMYYYYELCKTSDISQKEINLYMSQLTIKYPGKFEICKDTDIGICMKIKDTISNAVFVT